MPVNFLRRTHAAASSLFFTYIAYFSVFCFGVKHTHVENSVASGEAESYALSAQLGSDTREAAEELRKIGG